MKTEQKRIVGFFKALLNAVMVIITNIWIAYFSLKNIDWKSSDFGPDWIAILIGLVLLFFFCVLQKNYKELWESYKNRGLLTRKRKIVYVTLMIVFWILFIWGWKFEKYIFYIYGAAALILAITICVYQNEMFNVVFKQLLLNFICPTVSYLLIVLVVSHYPALFINKSITKETFMQFTEAFGFLLINILYVSSPAMIMFCASLFHKSETIDDKKDAKEFIVRRLIRKLLVADNTKSHNKTLNICAIFFLILYVIGTIAWICSCLGWKIPAGCITWQNYLCFMLLVGVIHVWIYALLKNIEAGKDIDKLFDKDGSYQNIMDQMKHLVWPDSFVKGADWTERIIKFLYFALWLFVSVVIVSLCHKLDVFGVNSGNGSAVSKYISGGLFILLIIGMGLNYVSYYLSMVFCYYTRVVANADDLECEKDIDNPWNSEKLRKLIGLSSRTSISFFVVSLMYLLSLAVCVMSLDLTDPAGKEACTLLVVLSIFLCGVSFLIVTFLPKLFLNRKFRNWKYAKVESLMGTNNETLIEKIWSSNLPYVRMEAIAGAVVLTINILSLAGSICAILGKISFHQ